MANDVTTYEVRTIYRAIDESTRVVREAERAVKEATHSSHELQHALHGALAVFGLHGLIHKAKEAFIGFNREVQNTKISLTSMIQGTFDIDLKRAQGITEDLYAEFQKFSTQTPVTTQQILEFGRGISGALFAAGGTMKDFIKLTEQGVVTTKALGVHGGNTAFGAMEISEMLAGNVRHGMLMPKLLLASVNKSMEEFRAMSAGDKLKTVMAAVNTQAMQDARTQMSTSFEGVVSTLEDKAQIFFGKIGKPLFEAITHEIQNWNEWIDKNDDKLQKFARDAGAGLVDAFKAVKSALSWIYDHGDTLITIGKVWAAIKIGNMIGGLPSMLGAGSEIGKVLGEGLKGALVKMSNLSLPTALLGQGVGAFANKFGGALGALGPGGVVGVGVAAYELSKAVGLQDMIHQAIDPVAAAFERIKASIEAFDESLVKAQRDAEGKFGSAGTATGGGYMKSQKDLAVEISAFTDAARFLGENEGSAKELAMRAMGGPSYRQLMRGRLQAQLAATGMTDTDIDQFLSGNGDAQIAFISRLQARGAQTTGNQNIAISETDRMMQLVALQAASKEGGLHDALADQKFWTQANNVVLQRMLIALQTGVKLSQEDVQKIVEDLAKKDKDLKTKVQQHVKISINQLTAKDPHRWLLDLESIASKRNRAQTTPNGAVNNPWKRS